MMIYDSLLVRDALALDGGYNDLPAPTLWLPLFASALALSLILAPKRALLLFELRFMFVSLPLGEII